MPPPTTTGATNTWHASTNPAAKAWEASPGPPMLMFRAALAFSCRTRRSNSRSMRPGAGRRLQCRGVDDLGGCSPDFREVLHTDRLSREVGYGFPIRHRLVHPAPVEVGADRTFEVVDEAVDLLVGCGPVEITVLVGDVASSDMIVE